jgi:hypothetical protein
MTTFQRSNVQPDGEFGSEDDHMQMMASIHGSLANHAAAKHRHKAFAEKTKTKEQLHSTPIKVDPMRVRFSRRVVNNKGFVALTTILTIYALIGDDIRLSQTNKPADLWFNVITVVCIVVFSFEIVISCWGKHDYIWGFFFTLDIVSTVTLFLDLPFTSELILGDGEDLDSMRSGRTARVGAKAGRVVRVIRLVRILKLYKAIYEEAQKRKKRHWDSEAHEWDDIETVNPEDKLQGLEESRVGKKLSEMTTRRVIVIVLVMLIVLPFLRAASEDQFPVSAYYGADEVYMAWLDVVKSPTDAESMLRYDEAVLKYLYYHNWYTGRSATCPNDDFDYGCSNWYYSHVFWIGITSTNESMLSDKVNSTRLRLENVVAWNEDAAQQNDIYNYGVMPDVVLPSIYVPWTDACSDRDKGIYRRGFSVLDKEIDGQLSYAVPCPQDLRLSELAKFYPRTLSPDIYTEWHFAFYFDSRLFTAQEAIFGLCVTAFVCVVLCIASLSFSTTTNKLVLNPVEQMITRVTAIRENPLIAMRMADDEFKLEEKQRAQLLNREQRVGLRSVGAKLVQCYKGDGTKQEPMETVVLEKTIIKLGSLLALGFGIAGVNIIEQNLACSDSAGVNVMIPGMKVQCIVGKLRINNFSIATEVLQEKVMTFANQIAEIVHGVVVQYWGYANKNNGESFLVIWRTSELDQATVKKYADMSMLAFAKILGAVHQAPVLAAYKTHPGLQLRLGAKSQVSLTFGLHAGWAIEGAVGSEFKIDASYLSPNVSIAASVEHATRTYQVPILVSQAVVENASSEMGSKCRLIDRVLIKGSTLPMHLYSLDLDSDAVVVDKPRDPKLQWNVRMRFKTRQFLESEKQSRMARSYQIVQEFEGERVISRMRRKYTLEFLQSFHMGFQNYINGEWQVARRLLAHSRTALIGFDDGPCKALLRFMEYPYDYQAPDGWTGIRELH